MKIVMLGHSGVGKTTYMASMFGRMHQGIDEFGLISPDSQVEGELLEACRRIHSGSYPVATDQRAEYDFQLTYQGKSCFPFTWLDFRGGAVNERRDSAESRALHEDLVTADGLLIFCDASAFSERRARRQIGRMIHLVSGAIQEIEHSIPLGIVLTKMDRIGAGSHADFETVLDGLVATISASETVHGSVMPVACGRQSQNVVLPVLFTLHLGIRCKVNHLNQFIEQRERERRRYESRRNLFDEIWSALVSEPSWSDLADAAGSDIYSQRRMLAPLVEPAQALSRYLDPLHTF